jgi:hypothetical protein
MAIAFSNLLKAQITQSLVKVLFERAGYRVGRLGVEELYGEVVHLSEEQYLSLGLPLALRYLPDLLVADQDLNKVYLVEVKYRKAFNEGAMRGLYKELKRQREFWPQSYAVVIVAEPIPEGGRFHQDHIRVVKPDKTECLNPESSTHIAEIGGHQCNMILDQYKRMGCEYIWSQLCILNRGFERFCGNSPEQAQNTVNADYLTAALKELKKL